MAALILVASAALALALIAVHGAADVFHSAARLGWAGFAAIVAFHLVLIALMGTAWWLLGTVRGVRTQRARAGRLALRCFVWGRLIRDSAAEVLPLSQIGGHVLGARALTLTGATGAFAAASTVVDVTVELVAQLFYTMGGLVLLDLLRPDNPIAGPILAGLAVMGLGVAGFVAVQASGAGMVERAVHRLAPRVLGRSVGADPAVQATIHALHRSPATLALAACVHLLSWMLSGVETWLTLKMMGVPIGILAALATDSLLYGMRSAAFFVPNALGVQEGGLILLGGLFGFGADVALALSLLKRARDLLIGIPALAAWQALEGRRVWRRSVTDPTRV
jgi:putative membrane protein